MNSIKIYYHLNFKIQKLYLDLNLKMKKKEERTFDIDEGIPYIMEKFDVRLGKIENIISDVNVFQTGIQKKLDL
jgi:hypothetical protein